MKKVFLLIPMLFLVTNIYCAGDREEMTEIETSINQYALVKIDVDRSALDSDQQKALDNLIEAAKAIDIIFWKQQPPEALRVREELENATTELDKLYKEYVEINYGPFDALLESERFYGAGSVRPEGAGYYPEDMTKEEFNNYVDAHPSKKSDLENLYSMVKRNGSDLVASFYHDEFAEHVKEASDALKAAASTIKNPSLKKYIELRAEAILTDDFYESDMAWMDLKDNMLDIVIGPIETYEDGLMGLKASFESAVMIKDIEASRQLDIFKSHLDNLEHSLPEDDKYKRETVGSGNLLEVVNIAYFSGDFNKAVKTIAASLPNDERVINQKGGKKQLYKNIMDAKFNKILVPLSQKLVVDEQHQYIYPENSVKDLSYSMHQHHSD